MKGATALPCASNSSAPITSITTSMGSSQNFLRVRKKLQNSFKKYFISLSFLELVCHGFRRRPRRTALNPIAASPRISLQTQWIFAAETEEVAHWGKYH